MTKIYIALVVVLLLGAGGWYAKQQYDAEQRGRAKVIAEQVARSNQLIAERRALDATFDKMDAAAVCRNAGFTWVFADGKSHCE